MTWTGHEHDQADFIIEPVGRGSARRYRVRPRRRDGKLARASHECETYSEADQLRTRCRDALRAGAPWAVALVEVPHRTLGLPPRVPER